MNAEAAGFKYSKDYAYEDVKGIEVRINPGCGKENRFHHTLFTSSFHYTAEKKTGDQRLYHQVSADTIIHTANEMFPEVLFSIYALDWQDEKHALTAGVYQAYQNFPKAIESSGDGIVLKLMPPEYGEMLKVPQGAARTSRFHLSFRTQDMTEDRIVDRELLFQRRWYRFWILRYILMRVCLEVWYPNSIIIVRNVFCSVMWIPGQRD